MTVDLSTEAPVMTDVALMTEMIHEEEKKVKSFTEMLGQKLKDAKVIAGCGTCWVRAPVLHCRFTADSCAFCVCMPRW